MDFASTWLSRVLYPIGISTDPQQVVIGYDNWLYLGDKYEQTRSVYRRAQTAADIENGKLVNAAMEAWEAYLASKGVKLFRIMIGPNKETIYPEQLPIWARPVSPTATDALIAGTGLMRYVDLRTALLAAKAVHRESLYYKTDTHWNYLGAGLAFRSFSQQVGGAAPELRWPSDDAFEVRRVVPRIGGDLANFLRLTASLSDSEPIINAQELPVETIQRDLESNKVIHKGGNPVVDSPSKPLLVTSAGALNAKKVLWLRDSFGNAISPLMAATFRDVVQLHWAEALKPGGRFAQLVETWKPDYVFVTVVERAARADLFASHPPTTSNPAAE